MQRSFLSDDKTVMMGSANVSLACSTMLPCWCELSLPARPPNRCRTTNSV